jgi:phosphatidylinositol-3-phosphatase
MSGRITLLLVAAMMGCAAAHSEAALPLYKHIFVIVEENRTTDQIIGNKLAPNFNRLAHKYGYASNFYAERHPSEPNYIAILGGDTFGISDDDAFYCKPESKEWGCGSSSTVGYVDHTVVAPSLTDQLSAKGLTWKGYFQDIPQPGSLTYAWPSPREPVVGKPEKLYAAKHNGFLTFANVQADPALATKIVGFDVLDQDIAANTLPNYAHIVPNQCNDMHGLHGIYVPEECASEAGLIRRADRTVGKIVGKIMGSRAWNGPDNVAIIITFDESGHTTGDHPGGCCGSVPGDRSNPGGGWIATIVVTNHGPRRLVDGTAYNHYSLLRTTEAAFGITEYLGLAGDTTHGVTTMAPLFATAASKKVADAPAGLLSKSIALGSPDKWDFLVYEAAFDRVFVSHGSEVTVVDPGRGAVVGRVSGIDGSHGVVVVPSLGRGYADAANPRTVVVFDAKTLQTLKTIPVGEDPDAMVYDEATKRVFVMDADGEAFTAIDAVNDKALATIPLGGKPEFAAVDGMGTLFINIASTNEIVRVDGRTLRVEARWKVPSCESPHGLAIDPTAGRLFASCENGKLIVVTTEGGRVVATLPIGRGSDAVAFDSKRKLVYSSNKDGTLSVIAVKGPDEFVPLDSVPTALGAKTMALDPVTGRVFLVTADVDHVGPPAQTGDLPDAVLKPGSVKLLVVEHPWQSAPSTPPSVRN